MRKTSSEIFGWNYSRIRSARAEASATAGVAMQSLEVLPEVRTRVRARLCFEVSVLETYTEVSQLITSFRGCFNRQVPRDPGATMVPVQDKGIRGRRLLAYVAPRVASPPTRSQRVEGGWATIRLPTGTKTVAAHS